MVGEGNVMVNEMITLPMKAVGKLLKVDYLVVDALSTYNTVVNESLKVNPAHLYPRLLPTSEAEAEAIHTIS